MTTQKKQNATEPQRDLRVWIKPETFQKLNQLAEKTNRTRATTVDHAIALFYEQEFAQDNLHGGTQK